MLAAQMEKSADKAVAAVPVVITAARPVAVVGKMFEHQVKQLHRLDDLGFWHWFERSRCGQQTQRIMGRRNPAAPHGYGKTIGSTRPGSLLVSVPMALTQAFRNDDVERTPSGKAENAHRAAVPHPDHSLGIRIDDRIGMPETRRSANCVGSICTFPPHKSGPALASAEPIAAIPSSRARGGEARQGRPACTGRALPGRLGALPPERSAAGRHPRLRSFLRHRSRAPLPYRLQCA
jgi:hypothetical protein